MYITDADIDWAAEVAQADEDALHNRAEADDRLDVYGRDIR